MRAFFFCHVFCFTENWALRNRQVPWRREPELAVPKAEPYFAATLHLSFLAWDCRSSGRSLGAGGLGRGCPGGRKPSWSHHPFVCILHLVIAEDESSAGFRVGLATQNEFCWHRFPNPFARLQQQTACSPSKGKARHKPATGTKARITL